MCVGFWECKSLVSCFFFFIIFCRLGLWGLGKRPQDPPSDSRPAPHQLCYTQTARPLPRFAPTSHAARSFLPSLICYLKSFCA